jgi:hypothetical protein
MNQLLHETRRIREDASLSKHRYGCRVVSVTKFCSHPLDGIEKDLDFHPVNKKSPSLSPSWTDENEEINVAVRTRDTVSKRANEEDPKQIVTEFSLEICHNRFKRYDTTCQRGA